jgi:hypothetical protein
MIRRLIRVVNKLSHLSLHEIERLLQERKNRKETVSEVGRLTAGGKVFGIGLTRTATTSLAVALDQLGYKTAHWRVDGKVTDLEDFYRFDAVTDTPCACRFEQLYRSFPGSKFILTERDVDRWESSVIEHFGCQNPKELLTDAYIEEKLASESGTGFSALNTMRWIFIHTSLYAQYETWSAAYQEYLNRVDRFFQGSRSNQLLRIDITTEAKPWDKICSFLGARVPEKSFPHAKSSRFHTAS